MTADRSHPRLPPRLRPGDTIGIAAPASHFKQEAFELGLQKLQSMGFKTHIPEGLFKKSDYLAGGDEHRADLLNRLFGDRKIKGIICARGGYGSLRILNYLDFKGIRQNPKAFIGFSDITAILTVLVTHCRMIAYHGPTLVGLGQSPLPTQRVLQDVLQAETGLTIKSHAGVTLREGFAEAPILGGNLTTLCHLTGTPFMPQLKGYILLLEDNGEALYRIDRMLHQMKLAGCLDGIAGMILGRFENCGAIEDIYKVVLEVFEADDIPILAGFEVGHGHAETNLTLPLGMPATLDTSYRQVSFHIPTKAR